MTYEGSTVSYSLQSTRLLSILLLLLLIIFQSTTLLPSWVIDSGSVESLLGWVAPTGRKPGLN